MVKTAGPRSIRTAAPLPPIRVGLPDPKRGWRSPGTILKVFMRVVAVLWLGEGVLQWAVLLLDQGSMMSVQRLTATGFFCVLNFIAGCGLWLAAPWGGVVWLVTLGGQLLCLATLPGFFSLPWLVGILDPILAVAYLILATLAARSQQQQR